MSEQSHREEMSAAIRAQRERRAVPKTIAPEREAEAGPPAESPAPGRAPEPDAARRWFIRRKRA